MKSQPKLPLTVIIRSMAIQRQRAVLTSVAAIITREQGNALGQRSYWDHLDVQWIHKTGPTH